MIECFIFLYLHKIMLKIWDCKNFHQRFCYCLLCILVYLCPLCYLVAIFVWVISAGAVLLIHDTEYFISFTSMKPPSYSCFVFLLPAAIMIDCCICCIRRYMSAWLAVMVVAPWHASPSPSYKWHHWLHSLSIMEGDQSLSFSTYSSVSVPLDGCVCILN